VNFECRGSKGYECRINFETILRQERIEVKTNEDKGRKNNKE